jgi:GPH family glycoside/pentoside/hexuronide:cation symporter
MTTTTAQTLGWGRMLGWAIGTIGPVTLLYLVSSAYLFFMTDLLGLSGALAGALIFSVRLYDAFADPIMGHVSDRTQTRMGRRRPWMLAGGFAATLGCIGLFTIPGSIAGSGTVPVAAWTLGALLVYFTGYTMFNVPYMAMSAEMTDTFQERTRLMSLRVLFVSLSSLLGAAMAPRLIEHFGGGVRSYELTSFVIGAIGLAAMLVCVLSTAGARATVATPLAMSVGSQIRVALANRPFLLLIGVKLLLLLSMSSVSATLFFFVRHVLHRDLSVAANIGLAQTLGMLAALPVWVRLARRFHKQHLFQVALAINTLVLLSWTLAGESDPVALLLIRAVVLGAFAGGALLMGQSMLPDTMEYDYKCSGLRREGAYSGLYSMVEKAGYAFGPLIVGSMLSMAGYVGSKPGSKLPVEFSSDAVTAIYLGVAVIPAVATGLCIWLLRYYTLTEATIRGMTPPTLGLGPPQPAAASGS